MRRNTPQTYAAGSCGILHSQTVTVHLSEAVLSSMVVNMEEGRELRFNFFSDHLVGAFKCLAAEGHFVDVTLVSDDQIQTKAHKVLLSAFSPVLKTLLVNNPHSHPLLFLRGIKQKELQAILNLIYFGETKVEESNVNKLMCIARDLGITDITSEQSEVDLPYITTVDEKSKHSDHEHENKTDNKTENPLERSDRDKIIMKHFDIVHDPAKTAEVDLPYFEVDEKSKYSDSDLNSDHDYEKNTENKYENPLEIKLETRTHLVEKKCFECDQCDKTFKEKYTLACHIRIVHLGIRSKCDLCGKSFTTKTHLTTHTKAVHSNIKRFSCSGCDYKTYGAGELRSHIKRVHKKTLDELILRNCENGVFPNIDSLMKEFVLADDSEAKEKKDEHSYPCVACPKSFSWKNTLMTHIRKFHGNK